MYICKTHSNYLQGFGRNVSAYLWFYFYSSNCCVDKWGSQHYMCSVWKIPDCFPDYQWWDDNVVSLIRHSVLAEMLHRERSCFWVQSCWGALNSTCSCRMGEGKALMYFLIESASWLATLQMQWCSDAFLPHCCIKSNMCHLLCDFIPCWSLPVVIEK